jgi:replicative DNA helicase
MKELPLYSEEAEKAILWDLILYPIWLIDLELIPEDFWWNSERIIFEIIKSLEIEDINIISIKEELEKQNKLKKVGWISYLIELTETINTWNIKSYENIIKDFSIKRDIYKLTKSVNSSLISSNWKDILLDIYSWLSVIEKTNKSKEDTLENLLWDTLDYIELIKWKDLIWYSFGSQFGWLDSCTGWMQRGKIYRIGWPSNVGKSWLLYNFLISLLSQTDKITFFSLENSKLDILKNFFWLKRKVNTLPAFIKKENYNFFKEADWFLKKTNFNISAEKNLDNIIRIALKNKSEFIFIDYIQLLQLNWPFKSDISKAEWIAQKLQDIASKYNIWIIDLSQVSNSTKSGWVDWSWSDELKGASAFKETADLVLHIFSNILSESAKQAWLDNWEKDKFFITYNKIKLTKNRLWPWVGSIKDYTLDFNLGWKYLLE